MKFPTPLFVLAGSFLMFFAGWALAGAMLTGLLDSSFGRMTDLFAP